MKSWKWQNLKDLIDSLSINEKRYFSLYQKEDRDKNYFKLYEAMQSKTDEKEVKKRLTKQGINISYEKSYLIKVLMKNLRNFHQDQGLHIELAQALIDIELLLEKKLYQFCNEFVDYYIELSKETESFTFLLQLIKWKRKCLIRLGDMIALQQFTLDENKIEEDCYHKMTINSKMRLLQQQMLVLINQKGNSLTEQDRAKMKEILANPLMKSPAKSMTVLTQLLRLEISIWGAYYFGKYEEAYQLALQMQALVESHPFIEQYHPQVYYAAMGSLYTRAYKLDQLESMQKALQNIQKMVINPKKFIPEDLKNEAMSFVLERK